MQEKLRQSGWALGSFRVFETGPNFCLNCGADLHGLTILRHPSYGHVCSERCAEEVEVSHIAEASQKPGK